MAVEEVCQTQEGQQTVYELQQHMNEVKNVFMDPKLTKNILHVTDKTLQEVTFDILIPTLEQHSNFSDSG